MKINIKRNSIRVRCTNDEISKITYGETVVNTSGFSALDRLLCSISKWNFKVFGAEIIGSSAYISIPSELLISWNPDADLSIEGVVGNGSDTGLKILIELDNPCEHK